MHPLAGAMQTTSVPLLQQPQLEQQQQLQHQKQQELVRPLQTPAEILVAPQLQQAGHGQQGTQLQQQLKLPGVHAQAKGHGANQAYAPTALQTKQVNHVSKQAQHAGPAKQAQTVVLAKQAQHAGLAQHAETQVTNTQAQQAQHASPAKQAQHASPAKQAQDAPQQAQRAPYALPAEHSTEQAAQQAKRMLSEQQELLPQIDQRGQNDVQAHSVKVSDHSEQLTPDRPASSANTNSSVKRHKVSIELGHPVLLVLCAVLVLALGHPLCLTNSVCICIRFTQQCSVIACRILTAWYGTQLAKHLCHCVLVCGATDSSNLGCE